MSVYHHEVQLTCNSALMTVLCIRPLPMCGHAAYFVDIFVCAPSQVARGHRCTCAQVRGTASATFVACHQLGTSVAQRFRPHLQGAAGGHLLNIASASQVSRTSQQ